MKNKNVRGILALAVVTALSFGVITGSRALAVDTGSTSQEDSGEVKEEFDVSGAENIEKAAATEDGYVVTVKEKGYGGDILMDVSFEADGETISYVSVTEHSETEGLGARIAEEEFSGQFVGMKAPVYLSGMSGGEEAAPAEKKAPEGAAESEGAVLQDGTYEAKGEADDSGFADQVTMTVKDGKITEVNWDSIGEDGSKKSVLSESGEYVMTEDGPTWAEQAKALTEALVENQNLTFLTMDEQGKTDAVSGVSISVGGFAALAEQCLNEAADVETEETAEEPAAEENKESAEAGTGEVQAVSGATISSTAAVTGINEAYEFLQTVK